MNENKILERSEEQTVIKNWMAQLATHYEEMQCQYPNEKLLILFDIDGTILDMRYMVQHLLKKYDRIHNTEHFQKLTLGDITVHENYISPLLDNLQIDLQAQRDILGWYEKFAWSSAEILEAHRPFAGVLEVIRWFQLQHNCYIGLNTARPERIRQETLESLNKLGTEYKIHFENALLYLMPNDWPQGAPAAKVEGIRSFQQAGYRLFAFVDNEPDNLHAISQFDTDNEILLLHADTIFQSKRSKLPQKAIAGNRYDLLDLATERTLPKHINFVWHNLNDPNNLAQFLASDVFWGEFDVRLNPIGDDLVLRHVSFTERPVRPDESWLTIDYALDRLRYAKKGIKLDIKTGAMIDQILASVVSYGFNGTNLWFSGKVEDIHESGFRKLATAHPGAIIQCPIDFLGPLLRHDPAKTKRILDKFQGWGINRFSLNWRTSDLRTLLDQLELWQFEVTIYNVPDLNTFLQAVLLRPHAITATYNFPKWHFFGRDTLAASQFQYSRKEIAIQNLEHHVLYRD